MKVKFVDGYYAFPATMIIINSFSALFGGNIESGFYRKKEKSIVIVKQKYIFYTIIILLHELLHFFNHEFFESNPKINNLIEEIQIKYINPILTKILIGLDNYG